MTRSFADLLFALGGLAVGAAPLVAGPTGSDAPRPNIVLFLADDLGLDAGCYGNAAIRTPNIDALAQTGLRFAQAYCTTASCSPSRAVILTGLQNHASGQYGLAHAANNFHVRPRIKTLPALLREAGYRTARYGRAVHVRPFEQFAFDVSVPAPREELTLADRLYGRDIVRCVDDTEAFITADEKRPFFLMVATCDAHRFATRFDGLAGQPNTFANDQTYAGVNETRYDPAEVRVPAYLTDNAETRAELAQYYQSVSRVDQGIGRMMELLRRTGRWNDTIILFTSDHGPPFPGGKTTAYEPGLRVPLIIRDPTQDQAGTASDALVSLVDLTPTILDYAGVATDGLGLHGRSLRPLTREPQPAGWDEVYASHTFHEVTMYYPMRVVRERRFKLIWNLAHGLDFPVAQDLWEASSWQSVLTAPLGEQRLGARTVEAYLRRPRFELYDLQADPNEITNLAEDPAHREILTRLQRKLQAFQAATEDPWELKWSRE